MSYIGNQITTAFTSMDKQDITGNGGANYTLSHAVANANEIEVFVNNVRQESGVAYTTSGTALNMTGNVASTDSFYVVYQGKAVGTISPPDGSVSDAKITAMAASKLTGALPASSFPSGSIIQVQSFDKLDDQIIIGTSFTDVMSVSITPTSTTSKILVRCDINISASTASEGATGSRYCAVKLYRDSTQIGLNTSILSSQSQVWFSSNSVEGNNSGYGQSNSSGSFMDSPSTTSAITYKIQAGNTHAASAYTYINRPPKNNDGALIHRGISNITVMEIAQ